MTSTTWTLVAAALSIALLLGLVIWVKLQPFIALLITSIGFGLATGTNPGDLST
ncbi:hypothetical protein [Saccharomonospora sp. CUA-673]|uniref:GntT/GntP/DsdX family permease n=1 Tax=Saccharomonospora sp. CUA-673 TaxID=1904969 RepID=UPI001C9E3411|nr:hypothetical protein [Saccharomonospora sp. CUA-673]